MKITTTVESRNWLEGMHDAGRLIDAAEMIRKQS